MIEVALFQILTGYAGLTALVGARAYPLLLPQNCTLPAVTYQRITTPREYSHAGPSGIASPTFQFNVWDSDILRAKQVAEQVRGALHGARNTTVAGVKIGGVTCVDEGDSYDQNSNAIGVQLDFEIWHHE